ncbi:MAG: FAD/NAD(P)-binding oxidoreductase [Methylococcaceae bacterium]|jgi:sulfide:quinone oxidoreductase|nr:FAD/NAD(P)-binding oxidoreductase [Methylococcaceae bacterium]MDZ4156165.1 FAD/NAD(P)-binding oxidoreductase [Methylococcales bacterium]MDP2393743.1 FAD/NAD(P)-binding oxidoreductase [Methylococcaceae bacterium]MDP3019769.1 FAD/NAD(P)-binding oxidoreductase [Methylococcaceae bacterium]MDP3390238.1 FAD/NAD(P)-binding oxidoreductase [Methylococcaceae bacterium]
MARIVVLGAGIGGVPMAYEMKETVGKNHEVIVISDSPTFHFVPSNPWVPPKWRTPEELKIELAPVFKKKGIEFIQKAATKIDAANNQVQLADGSNVPYDYLIIATGPRLAFDEVPGLGPEGYTSSVCHVDHAAVAAQDWDKFMENPGPIVIGAVQGASCFGPAYEYLMILETELRKRKIRDKVPMTLVTSEPYIGHLGLGGVGDTKGLLESALRSKSIKWVCNAKVDKIEPGMMFVTEVDEDGKDKKKHELAFKHSMMLPAFTGVDAVRHAGAEGLTNPRGFVIVDEHQRNKTFKNIYSVGVCVAIPPLEATPVPTGTPKTGYMIESMVTATAHNIAEELAGKAPSHIPTLNALCLADFGDSGVAFLAMPQIPPRNTTWSSEGRWVHLAKIGFEKYFMRKIRKGISEPFYEKAMLKLMGVVRLKGH